MNIPFVMKAEDQDADFLKFAADRDMSGLKGHRSIGGFRASIYNAMKEEGIDRLIDCISDYEKNKG